MREKIQVAAVAASHTIIFSNDLVEAVMETVAFLMGMLL